MTATPAVLAADLERMNAALRALGAVRTTADGYAYVDTAKVPADLIRAYRGLVSYGYANGLL